MVKSLCVERKQRKKFGSMGVGRGVQGGPWPPWILKLLAKKGCFFNFEG